MHDALGQWWGELVGRLDGPLMFRFILQPAVATFLALRAGWRDARAGRPAFFWSLVREPEQRLYLLREGWKDVGTVFLVAIAMDLAYERIVRAGFHPGHTLIVGTLLAIVPYLTVRGMANRFAAGLGVRPPGPPTDQAP